MSRSVPRSICGVLDAFRIGQVALAATESLKGFTSLSEGPGWCAWASAQSLETSLPSQREERKDYGWNADNGTGTALDCVVK